MNAVFRLRKIISVTLFFTFFFSLCHAALEDYFKKVENKPTIHQMKNIDFIYTINLDQRPEKFESCTKQLNPYGIYPYRFSAVNGWDLSLETINDLGVKFESWMQTGIMGTSYPLEQKGEPSHEKMHVVGKNYFCHCMARGSIGIVLSHLSVLQDAYDCGYETIWVMEDDIDVIQNPHLLSDLIDKLDKLVGSDGWDMMFTDCDTKNQQGKYVSCKSYAQRPNFKPANPQRFTERFNISADFSKLGARYGAYSMIVRRSGMEKVLNFLKTYSIFLPYDMEFYLPSDIRMYAVRKDVISTQINALSDNGGPNYQKKIKD